MYFFLNQCPDLAGRPGTRDDRRNSRRDEGRIAPHAIVCDAGYPKNLSPSAQMPGAKIFFGGLGHITGGLKFAPDFHGILNRHPFPDVVHGCLLDGMALALEGRFEPFLKGRGSITPERVEEIETMAARHGIHLGTGIQRCRTSGTRRHTVLTV
jgi:predicted amino acid dehydrogenase